MSRSPTGEDASIVTTTGADTPPSDARPGSPAGSQAGPRSDGRAGPPGPRGGLRLTTVYATSGELTAGQAAALGRRPSTFLRLGDLAAGYDDAHRQLPAVLGRQGLDTDTLTFERWTGTVDAAWAWLFVLPSGQITVAVTLDVRAGAVAAVPLLEDLHDAALDVTGVPLARHFARLLVDLDPDLQDVRLLPERHQVVFGPAPDGGPPADGVTGPAASTLAGLPDHLENAAFLAVVQIVTAGARLRRIREGALDGAAALRTGAALEDVAATLLGLGLDLSCNVESVAELGTVAPAAPVDGYHRALVDSLDLAARAATTGRLLERLTAAVTAELAGARAVQARADDVRSLRACLAALLATSAGVTGLLVAFLGIDARLVDPTRSVLDSRYLPVHLAIAAVLLCGTAVAATLRRPGRGAASRNR